MKKPAMQRSGLLLKLLICVQLRSEMKLVSTLYLHKEFGESVVGWFGEKWMEPMQCLTIAKASMDTRTGKSHCYACSWEIRGAPVMHHLDASASAGRNKATQILHLETREVTRNLAYDECIAKLHTFVSAPFVICPAFQNVSLLGGDVHCLVQCYCLVPKIMSHIYYSFSKQMLNK